MNKILYTFAASLLQLLIPAIVNAQVVTTDKVDYMPGDVVIASGEGWEPYEVIDLNLKEDPTVHAEVDSAFICDATGKFSKIIYEVTN